MNKKIDVPVKMDIADKELLARMVKPHHLISRSVQAQYDTEDIDRVIKESVVLYKLCFQPIGLYGSAFAMAHPQIDDQDPLRMFVTAEKQIILNPRIIKHSGYTVDSKEGCMTLPELPTINVPRWHKCEVEYKTVMIDPEDPNKFVLSGYQEDSLSGQKAYIWQHEIDHLNGRYIYDDLLEKLNNEKQNV
jgi:peptide deformylase